uniref:Dual specificity protein phosphatase n=1 Tax=Neolamprologus brichardi TaxID=32507 RepID=A0A3Q4HI95_NEOBR
METISRLMSPSTLSSRGGERRSYSLRILYGVFKIALDGLYNIIIANDRYSLWKLGITHVVNAAHGKTHCQGSHYFYGSTVDYYGVPADDSPSFDLSRYFFPSAEYIHNALDTTSARVLVHCAVGVSRSASIVLAYLMIHHNYTLLDAINKVKERRWIFPNRGFLKQLHALDTKLQKTS